MFDCKKILRYVYCQSAFTALTFDDKAASLRSAVAFLICNYLHISIEESRFLCYN